MIKGIGVDIVEIKRFRKLIHEGGDRFLNRCFTKDEIDYCLGKKKSVVHFSGIFAAKEAVYKALGLRWEKGFNWKQIQIAHDNPAVDKPWVLLSGFVKEASDQLSVTTVHLSISHSMEYAVAMVVLSE